MKISKLLCAFAISALSVTNVMAQQTYEEMEQLTVNEQVTTVITATEPIRFVDISTDKVVGDQPMNNTIRLKPKDSLYVDGEVLAIVTIVTERYRTQYALLYTTRLQEAVTDKEVQRQEMMPYNNPAVSMSTEEMTRFARQIWNSPARIRNVSTKQHRMVMRLNNIYSAGDYFFIDYSIENRTNIRFDIDQVRVKLSDKKLSKATNAQVIELNPLEFLTMLYGNLKAVEQSGRIGMSEFETYEMGMATDYDKDQKEIEELMLRFLPSYMQDLYHGIYVVPERTESSLRNLFSQSASKHYFFEDMPSIANPLGIGNRAMPIACKVQNLLIADFLNYLALRHNVYLSTLDEILKKKSTSKP